MAYTIKERIVTDNLSILEAIVHGVQSNQGEWTLMGWRYYKVNELLKNAEYFPQHGYAHLRKIVKVAEVPEGTRISLKQDAIMESRRAHTHIHIDWRALIDTQVQLGKQEFDIDCIVPKGEQPNASDVVEYLSQYKLAPYAGVSATPKPDGTVHLFFPVAPIGYDPYEAKRRSPFDLLDE